MIAFFNELMEGLRVVVSTYFNDLEFAEGVTIGWILLTIACFAVVISHLVGRLK